MARLPLPLAFLLGALTACDGGTTGYNGDKTSDYFNALGVTRSTYANEDQKAVPDDLIVEPLLPNEVVDGREIVTLEQRLDDDEETFLGGVRWSTLTGDATLIHGWAGPDGVYTTFDPPVNVTQDDGYMKIGESVTTETGGMTFTSTFDKKEDCPVLWTPDPWEDCFVVIIDDGGGDVSAADAPTRPIFVGTYHLVTRFFMAWMDTRGYDGKWILSDYDDPEDVK